jgi:Zn-dependent peptidase ImmA (M78 family)
MSQPFGLKMANQKAEAVLRDDGIETLPINPFAIAASRDIVVDAKPDTVEGVSGMLLRHGNVFGILYATNVPSEGFQRFSVSHELGHYFLDGHIDYVLPRDGFHASHAGFVSADPYELEADHFAAGLLMPSGLFKPALNKVSVGLSAVESMANLCKTSLTATAIRYAELTSEAVAVIISSGQSIDYCFLSEAMKSLPELTWLRKGSPVPRSTETARMNADPGRILRADRTANEIDVMDWLGGTRSAMVTEEVLGLGRYGKTLTILSSESLGQDDDEDKEEGEEDLIESWTPRFRR